MTHDFDIRVYNGSGSLVAAGSTKNLSTQQPLEIVRWNTSGSGNVPYDIEIEEKAGSGASVLKYVLYSGTAATVAEFATNSSTIFGHPTANGAIAVGAVPWYSPSAIEPFSSWGDVTIYFDADGNRLDTPEVRHKPDVVAPDGVNTTFFGSDIPDDADSYPNFFGTSAAAPHVAGAAALVLDAIAPDAPGITRRSDRHGGRSRRGRRRSHLRIRPRRCGSRADRWASGHGRHSTGSLAGVADRHASLAGAVAARQVLGAARIRPGRDGGQLCARRRRRR